MGLLVESPELNRQLGDAVQRDFLEGNAWRLGFDERGRVTWVSGEEVLTAQPVDSTLQLLEDWFFSLLPLESEL